MDLGTIAIMALLVYASFDTILERFRATRTSATLRPPSWSRPRKVILVSAALIGLGLAAGTVLYACFGHPLIEAAYRGESLEIFNRYLRNHRARVALDGHPRDLEHYFTMGRVLWSRLALVGVAASVVVVGWLLRREAIAFLRVFFTTATHPVNLAFFRIVLFGTLLLSPRLFDAMFYSRLPTELRFEPGGFGWVLSHLPWSEASVTVAINLYLLACLTGMIGFYSRSSALLAAVLGFYVLGIPQMFGKVNHSHHLLWFSALLAASRCGDALGVDAVLAAWKRADRGVTAPPGPAAAYTAPLRFVAILLGVIYFFPGFWKVWVGGVDWVWSDNLRYQMYSKWLEFGDWVPVFRLDQYPLLYKLAAFTTVAFELSFVGLVFLPTLFVLAPLGGMLFHGMSALFMRIFFASLVRCYVALFDWHGIFTRLGRRLYRDEMFVLYDGGCRLCRRTVASVRVFDVFERVVYLEAADQGTRAAHGLTWLDADALMVDMHSVVQRATYRGFAAYRAWAARIPVLWPVLPLLYLWPLPGLGATLYRRVADSRTCRIVDRPTPDRVAETAPALGPAVAVIGVFLIAANVFFGLRQEGKAWPFACYPTFSDRKTGPEGVSLEVAVLNAAGEPVPFNPRAVSETFSSERWRGLLGEVLDIEDPADRSRRLRALWRLWGQGHPALHHGGTVRFYRVTLVTIPEQRHRNPLGRELLWELRQ